MRDVERILRSPVIAALPGGRLSPEALNAPVDVYFMLGGIDEYLIWPAGDCPAASNLMGLWVP